MKKIGYLLAVAAALALLLTGCSSAGEKNLKVYRELQQEILALPEAAFSLDMELAFPKNGSLLWDMTGTFSREPKEMEAEFAISFKDPAAQADLSLGLALCLVEQAAYMDASALFDGVLSGLYGIDDPSIAESLLEPGTYLEIRYDDYIDEAAAADREAYEQFSADLMAINLEIPEEALLEGLSREGDTFTLTLEAEVLRSAGLDFLERLFAVLLADDSPLFSGDLLSEIDMPFGGISGNSFLRTLLIELSKELQKTIKAADLEGLVYTETLSVKDGTYSQTLELSLPDTFYLTGESTITATAVEPVQIPENTITLEEWETRVEEWVAERTLSELGDYTVAYDLENTALADHDLAGKPALVQAVLPGGDGGGHAVTVFADCELEAYEPEDGYGAELYCYGDALTLLYLAVPDYSALEVVSFYASEDVQLSRSEGAQTTMSPLRLSTDGTAAFMALAETSADGRYVAFYLAEEDAPSGETLVLCVWVSVDTLTDEELRALEALGDCVGVDFTAYLSTLFTETV